MAELIRKYRRLHREVQEAIKRKDLEEVTRLAQERAKLRLQLYYR